MNDLVSIIVPIYKVEPYLRRCLDSIVNQTYTNLEIILVDDGSPDNCPQICDEYAKKDKRIVVIHQENKGLSCARNAGLGICKGEYVSFVDSDDFLSPQCIRTLYNGCKNNSADIAIGNYQSFKNEKEILTHPLQNSFKALSFEESMIMQSFQHPQFTQIVVAWNKIIKTSIAKQHPFPPNKLCEDNYTTYKYFWNTKVVITNDILYFYQNRSNSIANNIKGTTDDDLITLDYTNKKIDFLRSKGYNNLAVFLFKKIVKHELTRYLLSDDKILQKNIEDFLRRNRLKGFPSLNFAVFFPRIWKCLKKSRPKKQLESIIL